MRRAYGARPLQTSRRPKTHPRPPPLRSAHQTARRVPPPCPPSPPRSLAPSARLAPCPSPSFSSNSPAPRRFALLVASATPAPDEQTRRPGCLSKPSTSKQSAARRPPPASSDHDSTCPWLLLLYHTLLSDAPGVAPFPACLRRRQITNKHPACPLPRPSTTPTLLAAHGPQRITCTSHSTRPTSNAQRVRTAPGTKPQNGRPATQLSPCLRLTRGTPLRRRQPPPAPTT